MSYRKWAAATLATVALAGCSSLSSTYVGDASPGAKFEGMPIVVQRPKYMKVTVKDVIYGVLANRTSTNDNGASLATVDILGQQTFREVLIDLVSVGEVYALDLKRPAAGTTEYAVEFETNSQYPKKVGAKIEDKTIAELSDALKKTAEVFKPVSSESVAKKADADLVRLGEKIVRIELRSLADPTAAPVVLYSTDK